MAQEGVKFLYFDSAVNSWLLYLDSIAVMDPKLCQLRPNKPSCCHGWSYLTRTLLNLLFDLTIENKTVLGLKNLKGQEPAINNDLSSQQFLMMTDFLKRSDLIHYEISNFGKEGFFAKHNSNYWLQKEYLGLGPSAHSFNGTSRQWNIKNNNLYIKALEQNLNYFEKEELSINDRFNEYVLTRLRTIWGCDAEEIKLLFGESIHSHFLKTVEQKRTDFEINNGVYTLTPQARLFADGIASDFFIE